jgi:hypothetical protein
VNHVRTIEHKLLEEIKSLLLIQQQGFKHMAQTITDMKAAIAAVSDQMTAHLQNQATVKTSLDAAVADLATAVASGQADLITTVTTAMTALSGQLATAKANDDAMQAELTAALATVPPPTS